MASATTVAGASGALAGNTQTIGKYNPLKTTPLREAPDQPDRYDPERIEVFSNEYLSQTQVLLIRDRQIEYNVRMLCGQQRNVWHPGLSQFFDVSNWLSDEERAWRQLVVINKEQRWFVITHARLTENAPILTVLPGPDRKDSELAEVLDTLLKKDWRDAGMEEVHDELMMWLIVAGRAHAISRIDPTKGTWKPWIAQARVPFVNPDGTPMMDPMTGEPRLTPEMLPNIPLSPDGSPNAAILPNGQLQVLGPPHMERAGGIAVDAYSPLQVRGQWGPQLWRKKEWHTVQRFLTPEQCYEYWGVEVAPDLTGSAAANVATLERVLFGAGFYGQTIGRLGSGWADSSVKGPLCTVYQRWQAPAPFNEKLIGTWAEPMMQTPDAPGGRETIWTPNTLIKDGPREVAWMHTSPVRCFDFIRVAGRPSGLTPLETLHGPQRSYNQSRQQEIEHAALLGNPQIVVDQDSGLQQSQITNAPGEVYVATRRQGVPAIEYVIAPPLSPDVYKMTEYAGREIDELGGLAGTEGNAPTEDASGELVKELRFNSDRLLGAVSRRNVMEYALMADDWRALYPIIYDQQTVIAINGADNLAETLTVLPDLFKEGSAQVQPDAESMLPEGRGERQAAAKWNWANGAFGPFGSDQAREIYLEQSRFPNYSRLAKPGGVDRVTAEQENGKILAGQTHQPVLDWYDHFVHLAVHEKYMKSPEFLKQDEMVQQAFAFHRLQHLIKVSQLMQQPQLTAGAGGGETPGGGPDGSGPGESQDATMPGQAAPPKSVAASGGRAPTAPSRPQS